jgi:excisionase family DNA binding protein
MSTLRTATPGKVLTVREVAEYLKVHPATIYRLIKSRGLPGFKVGSDWRFNIESIERWCLETASHDIGEKRKKT